MNPKEQCHACFSSNKLPCPFFKGSLNIKGVILKHGYIFNFKKKHWKDNNVYINNNLKLLNTLHGTIPLRKVFFQIAKGRYCLTCLSKNRRNNMFSGIKEGLWNKSQCVFSTYRVIIFLFYIAHMQFMLMIYHPSMPDCRS